MSYQSFAKPPGPFNADSLVEWMQARRLLLNITADVADQVCQVCSGSTGLADDGEHYPQCYQCLQAARDTQSMDDGPFSRFMSGDPLAGVVPISYSLEPLLESAIYHAKSTTTSRWLNSVLAATLHRFLARHWDCIEAEYGTLDVVTIIPSHPDTRDGWDHLRFLVERVDNSKHMSWPHRERWNYDLLRKTARDKTTRAVDADRFVVTADVTGQRVLLIDDTYTSGATIRSAANALRRAGARRSVALTLGRQVNQTGLSKYLWDELVAQYGQHVPFAFDTCVVHRP